MTAKARISIAARWPFLFVILLASFFCGCAANPPCPPMSETPPFPDAAHSATTGQIPITPASVQPTVAESKSAESTTEPAKCPPAEEEKKDLKKVVEVHGRIQAEAALVGQSARNQQILGTVEDGTGFRRARLGAEGMIGEQVHWVADFDFANANIAFKNVFVAVENLPFVREVRVGHFLEPFSLELATSSNTFPFVERSPMVALDPGFSWGVGIYSYTEDQRLTFQAGAFRSGTNNTGNDFGTTNDIGYTFRVTGLPWYDDSQDSYRLLHVGGAFSHQFPKNNVVTFNQGPQSNLLEFTDNPLTPFVKNLSINADLYQLYNLQSALVIGPFCVEAEATVATVNQIGGGPVNLYGAYIFGSWFLTGEHREYNTKYGKFTTTHVRSPFACMDASHPYKGGIGAWELLARLDYLHFNSPNLPPDSNGLRVGEDVTELTLGVNWYLNDNARVMFNYIHAVPVDPNFGPSWANAFFIEAAVFW
jgi:phosphate-selective porin OprO/OprP